MVSSIFHVIQLQQTRPLMRRALGNSRSLGEYFNTLFHCDYCYWRRANSYARTFQPQPTFNELPNVNSGNCITCPVFVLYNKDEVKIYVRLLLFHVKITSRISLKFRTEIVYDYYTGCSLRW